MKESRGEMRMREEREKKRSNFKILKYFIKYFKYFKLKPEKEI